MTVPIPRSQNRLGTPGASSVEPAPTPTRRDRGGVVQHQPRHLLDLPAELLQDEILPHVVRGKGGLVHFSLTSRAAKQLAQEAATRVVQVNNQRLGTA